MLWEHPQSSLARQAQVEQDNVMGLTGQRRLGGLAALDPVHGLSLQV